MRRPPRPALLLAACLLAAVPISAQASPEAEAVPGAEPGAKSEAAVVEPTLPPLVPPGPVPSEAVSPAPFRLGWADAGIGAAAAAFSVYAQYRYQGMAPADPSRLRRGDLNAFDRWAAGNYSAEAALASDIVLFPLLAAPILLSALDARAAGAGWSPLLVEAVVLAEAVALSSSLNLAVRSLRVHPRPYLYGSDAPEEKLAKGEASGSFYSGHANGAFLAATYLAYTYPLRHPGFKGEAWLWAGSLGAAATVAGLRVAAGKHFPSDVVTGAAAGMLFGWLFPRLHLAPGAPGAGLRAELRMLPVEEGVHPALVVRF